jgi:membrane peptidoglycan carboxypeptidase
LSVAAAAKTGLVADNNLYYGATTDRWFWGPTEYTTMATWKTNSGQDAAGKNEDPVVVTPYTNLHLQAGSPCKLAGAAGLGVAPLAPPLAPAPACGCDASPTPFCTRAAAAASTRDSGACAIGEQRDP